MGKRERDSEAMSAAALEKAHAAMAERTRPRLEYVKVIHEGRHVLILPFTAGTLEENGAAGRVKAVLVANPGARAVVSSRCHGALEGVPAVGEHDPRVTPVDEKALDPVQLRVLATLAETGTRMRFEGVEKRAAGGLTKRGFAVRYGDALPSEYKVSERGRERLKEGA